MPEIPHAAPGRDLFRAGPRTYVPHTGPSPGYYPRYGLRAPGSWFPGAGFGWGYAAQAEARGPEPAALAAGFLRLDVQPKAAEVYLDGYYVGTIADIGESGLGLALDARPHRVDIRASGFESAGVDVRIVPPEIVTYRKVLTRIEDRLEPIVRGPAPANPKTIYVIPGCYAGSVFPTAAQLPAGCNPADVRAIQPTRKSVS
jgi:hypothetical protein